MKRHKYTVAIASLAISSVAIAASSAIASNTTWTGPSVGYWSDANNWTDTQFGHIVPQNNVPHQFDFHDVFISNAAVTMDVTHATVTKVFLTNNASLSISTDCQLDLDGFAGGIAGTIFVQNGGGLRSFDTGPAFTQGLIKLQSTGTRITEYTAMATQFFPYFENYADIWLAGLTNDALDRVVGGTPGATPGTPTFRNRGTLRGAGDVYNFSGFENLGTVIGGGVTKQLLKIDSTSFDNSQGTLKVLPGGALRIEATTLTNLVNHLIDGGTYDIAGRLILPHAQPFNNLRGDITLRGESFITANGSSDLLYGAFQNSRNLTITDNGQQTFGTAEVFTNRGKTIVDKGATLTFGGLLLNDGNGYGFFVGSMQGKTPVPATVIGKGRDNRGPLKVTAGLADFRANVPDMFKNVPADTSRLSSGAIDLGATATLIVDANSGPNGGEIRSTASGTELTLRRGGQFQYGPASLDALVHLEENGGLLKILGGEHTFTPVGGLFRNYNNGGFAGGSLTVGNLGTRVAIAGDFQNFDSIEVKDSALLYSTEDTDLLSQSNTNVRTGATLGSAKALSNSGELLVDSAFLSVTNTFTNTGETTIDHIGYGDTGAIENTGKLVVKNGSLVSAIALFHNGVGGVAELGVAGGATDRANFTTFENEGSVAMADSVIAQGDHYHQAAGLTALKGATMVVPDIQIAGGEFTGSVKITGDLANTGGFVQPEAGKIVITGDYEQLAGGTFITTIGTTDLLVLTGDIDLSGLLKANLLEGLIVQPGDEFEVLRFEGTLTGNFTSFDFPSTNGLTFQEVIGAHNISLVAVVPEPTTALVLTAMLSGGLIRRRQR